jgi:hypothetical protein
LSHPAAAIIAFVFGQQGPMANATIEGSRLGRIERQPARRAGAVAAAPRRRVRLATAPQRC